MQAAGYDPFAPGHYPVGVRTIRAHDSARGRLFPCEIWYPAVTGTADEPAEPEEKRDAAARPGSHPLIVFSHFSGGNRRSATFLCTHLAGHGYAVAALEHSEVVAEELAPREGESAAERSRRIDAIIAARVPDIRFLLDYLLNPEPGSGIAGIELDAARIGLVGHSFGGWSVLATLEVEPRVRSVVAMGAGGSSNPLPGVLPLSLTFDWGRDVPTLYLAAENDVPIPLDRVVELFDRTRSPKRMFILRRADHQHFMDDVEGMHEALRTMTLSGDAAWIPAAMRPIAELTSGEQAHQFVRGLSLAHLDATLRDLDAAERFLDGDVEAELTARDIEAITHVP